MEVTHQNEPINITHSDEYVVIDIPQYEIALEMTPAQARHLAGLLNTHAFALAPDEGAKPTLPRGKGKR